MKKVIISVLFTVLATASIASATTTWTNVESPSVDPVANGVIGSTVFQVSTNVKLIADGNPGGYNCTSKHLSGDKNFISSSVSASIEETTGVKGVPLAALILSTISDNVYTGTAGY